MGDLGKTLGVLGGSLGGPWGPWRSQRGARDYDLDLAVGCPEDTCACVAPLVLSCVPSTNASLLSFLDNELTRTISRRFLTVINALRQRLTRLGAPVLSLLREGVVASHKERSLATSEW